MGMVLNFNQVHSYESLQIDNHDSHYLKYDTYCLN